jgi:hypothetical protein
MGVFRKSVMLGCLAAAAVAASLLVGSVQAVDACGEGGASGETGRVTVGFSNVVDSNGVPIPGSAQTIAADGEGTLELPKSFRDSLLEYVASMGKPLQVDEAVINGLKDIPVYSPPGKPASQEDIVRTGLWAQRLTLVPVGNMMTVIPMQSAITHARTVDIGKLAECHPLEFVKCVIPCGPADAALVRTAVAPLVTREAVVSPIQGVNCLLAADVAERIQNIVDMVELIKSSVPDDFDPKYPAGRPQHMESRLVVVDIPAGLSADVVTGALTEVLGLKGQLSEDGRRYLYRVHSFRQEEERAEQVAQALEALKKK